jgi:hypothetical protein
LVDKITLLAVPNPRKGKSLPRGTSRKTYVHPEVQKHFPIFFLVTKKYLEVGKDWKDFFPLWFLIGRARSLALQVMVSCCYSISLRSLRLYCVLQ